MSELAQRRVRDFQQRCSEYGETALHLAYHAALPVALNADLLHFLRINFFLDPPEPLPYTIEFEFLLSPLCREIDEGLYEVEPEIRDILLAGLAQQYDEERIRDVATLLWQYVDRFSAWSDRVELERTQQLTALNFLNSQKAKQWLSNVETQLLQGITAEREWFVAMQQEIESQVEINHNAHSISEQRAHSSRKDFFISYVRQDKDIALRIAYILEQAGYSTIVADWDFRIGGNFVLEMQQSIMQTDRTIAILSEPYLNSTFAASEWAQAFIQNSPGDYPKLLPIRVQECNPRGLLATIMYLDLVGVDENTLRRKLLEAVSKRRKQSSLLNAQNTSVKSSLTEQHETQAALLIQSEPVEIYISYSHHDKGLKDELLEHLSSLQQEGLAAIWHDGLLLPGNTWLNEIDVHLSSAKIVLFLVSPSSISSTFISSVEMTRVMERHNKGETVVIPIILRPCNWETLPFARLPVLPQDGQPVTEQKHRGVAFESITQAIRQTVEQVNSRSQVFVNELSTGNTRKIRREKATLQEQYISLSRELRILQRDYANEVNTARRSRLQRQIEEVDTELERIDNALEELEQDLQSDF